MRLLTSLAPGADTLVADEAEKVFPGLEVVVPLPFPLTDYLDRSATFDAWRKAADEADTQLAAAPPPAEGAREALKRTASRWTCHRRRLEQLHDKGQAFFVPLVADPPEGPDAATITADLADATQRALRTRAAGEYVAAHCSLLIVISPDDVRAMTWHGPGGGQPGRPPAGRLPLASELAGGCRAEPDEVMLCKLRGTTVGLTSPEAAFTWADVGMAVHVAVGRPGPAAPPEAEITALYPIDLRPMGDFLPGGLSDHLDPAMPEKDDREWHTERGRAFANDVSNLARFHEQALGHRVSLFGWHAWLGKAVDNQLKAIPAEWPVGPVPLGDRIKRVARVVLREIVRMPPVNKKNGDLKWPKADNGDVDLWGHLFGHRSAVVNGMQEVGEAATAFRTEKIPAAELPAGDGDVLTSDALAEYASEPDATKVPGGTAGALEPVMHFQVGFLGVFARRPSKRARFRDPTVEYPEKCWLRVHNRL